MFAGKRPVASNEAYWRAKLAGQGQITAGGGSLVEKLQSKAASGLRAAGMDKHNANRLASKTLRALNDLTPVGNATMASDGAQQARRGYQKGSVWDAVAGSGQVALAALPGAVSRPAKGLFGKGIRAWHGSPHDFDKFSLAKIGTGEGAQAYGHGLYFAENPDVAKMYQQSLAGNVGNQQTAMGAADRAIGLSNGDRAAAIENVHGQIRAMQRQIAAMEAKGIAVPQVFSGRIAEEYEPALKLLEEGYNPGGRLYEVNINAKPDELLDWDAKVGDQPAIREALAPLADKLGSVGKYAISPDFSGRALYGALDGIRLPVGSPYAGLSKMRAPTMFKDHGIAGLRYLDQGSRYNSGTKTSNYVVFDDRLIDILNKY